MKVLTSGIQAFSHAAALDKDGRLSNTIYCIGKEVFILNQDNSVLIRFEFPRLEFENPICFRSEDYDSNEIFEDEGKVVFVRRNELYKREKSCQVPGKTPEALQEMWQKLREELIPGPSTELHVSLLDMLDQNLSHIEIQVVSQKLKIAQRNIYSGAVIEVSRREDRKGFGLTSSDSFKEKNYGPVGMRTGDFSALFSFCDSLKLVFPKDPGSGYFYIKGPKAPGMPGILEAYVGLCVYDEMGELTYLLKSGGEDNGRKEQEVRNSKSSTNRPVKARTQKA